MTKELNRLKQTLKELGIGDRLFNDIFHLVKNNPDQYFLMEHYQINTDVSPLLLSKTTFPEKLFKVFSNLNIYNIIYLNIHLGKHLFKCKSKYGKVYDVLLDKKDYKSSKDAFVFALAKFIEDIQRDNISKDT